MIAYVPATAENLTEALDIRERCMREISGLSALPEGFREKTACFLRTGNQTTLLAVDSGEVVGCATLCYLDLLPTADHPGGLRAHLMNVYTVPAHRRLGIARELISWLLTQARQRGVTEVSLDSTEAGRPLYRSMGFADSAEAMTIHL